MGKLGNPRLSESRKRWFESNRPDHYVRVVEWYTRQLEVLMPQGMQVQILSRTPIPANASANAEVCNHGGSVVRAAYHSRPVTFMDR